MPTKKMAQLYIMQIGHNIFNAPAISKIDMLSAILNIGPKLFLICRKLVITNPDKMIPTIINTLCAIAIVKSFLI